MISANEFGIICRNHLPISFWARVGSGQMISANNSEIICRNHLPKKQAAPRSSPETYNRACQTFDRACQTFDTRFRRAQKCVTERVKRWTGDANPILHPGGAHAPPGCKIANVCYLSSTSRGMCNRDRKCFYLSSTSRGMCNSDRKRLLSCIGGVRTHPPDAR